jgi:hypothetical protein
MKVLMLMLWSFIPPGSGYFVDQDQVVFYYAGEASSVLVSGNFNKWSRDDNRWAMEYDAESKTWKLTIPKKEIIRSISGNFYEFTFRVDGVLVDADKNNKNVIHCQGYGYRYVIDGI